MASYSVAEAKNRLPALINKAAAGEEVIITRHGKAIVELRPTPRVADKSLRSAAYERLRSLRESGPVIGKTSVEILNEMYEEQDVESLSRR